MDLKFLKDYSEWYVKVGSRVTCVPPPLDTDQDVLVYTTDYYGLHSFLKKEDWQLEDYGTMAQFTSFHKGEWNLIVADTLDWAEKFLKATAECKKKNVLDKAKRIEIFDTYFAKPMVVKWTDLYTASKLGSWNVDVTNQQLAQNMQAQAQANGGNPYSQPANPASFGLFPETQSPYAQSGDFFHTSTAGDGSW